MYKAEITGRGAYRFKISAGGYEFYAGSKGDGASPPDLLLASLGSCIGVYMQKYADGAKLELGDYRITVEADLGKEAPYCFRQIDVAIDLSRSGIDDRRKRSLVEFIKNCPVHNTLKIGPAVNVTIS